MSKNMPIKTYNKTCLRYTRTIKTIQNKSQILGKSKMTPIICFKGGMNLGKRLVKAAVPLKTQKFYI